MTPAPEVPPTAAAASGWRPRAITLWERRLLALLIVLFLVRNLPWRLDDYDQAKQAFTSLEMIDGGSWWFQHKPGFRGLATKPPLVGWMSAAAWSLTGGNWEIAWRLPSLLAAVALVFLLWRAGERIWPGRGGLVAAAAMGFNLLTPHLATLVRTDAVLTLWITLLGLIVWRHVCPGGPAWTPRARWTVFALMTATMMTKGPIVYAFLLPGMLAHWWVGRRHGENAAQLWGGWWPWTLPLLPFALWLERGIVTMPGFYDEVVGREFLGRFTVGEQAVHHNQSVFFYVAQLAVHWLPWSILLAAVAWQAWGGGSGSIWRVLWREPGTRWLVCWAAGGLLALSLVPSKRTDRIYPVVPALCLVLTAALAAAQRQTEETPAAPPINTLIWTTPGERWPQRWAGWTVAASAVLATAMTLKPVAAAYLHRDAARANFGARVRDTLGERRCELVVGKGWTSEDETMLLYLRRLRFLRSADAVQAVSTGKLDAVVISDEGLDRTRQRDDPLASYFSDRPELVSGGAAPHFRLLVRPPPTPPAPPPTRTPPQKKANAR